MKAGDYRHRIDLQAYTQTQDANGDVVGVWADFATDVPAAWLPGPGREYLAAESVRAEVAGRFVIRYLPGVTAQMRAVWDGQFWEIKAPPMLDKTARREMTLMVGAGVNDG